MIKNELTYAARSIKLTARTLDFATSVLKYEKFLDESPDNRISKGLRNLFFQIKDTMLKFVDKLSNRIDQMRPAEFNLKKHPKEELYEFFLKEIEAFEEKISFMEARWKGFLWMVFEGKIPNEYILETFKDLPNEDSFRPLTKNTHEFRYDL
jgi:hypothetical protein